MATKTSKKKTASNTPANLVLTAMWLAQATAVDWADQFGVKFSNTPRRYVLSTIDDLERGNIKLTPSNNIICFTKSGQLAGGHSIIQAVAASGVGCWVYVAYDLPEDAIIDDRYQPARPLSSILKMNGTFLYTGLVANLASFDVKLALNKYTLSQVLDNKGGVHASRYDGYNSALTNKESFEGIADLGLQMSSNTMAKGQFSYIKFIYLINQFGTDAQKACLRQFCTDFATNPKANINVRRALEAIRNRIGELSDGARLNTRWVVGILLRAFVAYAAGKRVSKIENIEATIADFDKKQVAPWQATH